MTAAIRACNPNGTDYIWLFSDEMKDDMSDELQSKLNEYDKLYYYYRDTATIDITSSLLTSYNNLITKYSKYQDNLTSLPSSITGYSQLMEAYYSTVDMALLLESSLMPGITVPEYTAQQQVELLTSEMPSTIGTTSVTALSLSSADNMVLSYVRSVLYSAFKVEIGKSSLNGTTWSGNFVITNYADSNDTSTSQYFTVHINENYEQYVKQRIDKILNKADQDVYGITGLFNQSDDVFKSELKKYSLNRLNSFYSACQACLDIMIQSNVADSNSDYKDLYDALYVPYLNKLQYIQNEINVRDKEIRIIQGYINNQGNLVDTGLQQELLKKRDEIQDILNLQNYLGTDLWKEFASFRREDLYQNTNYISDGLNNTELFQNAKEFIVKATQELYKSSNLQHSITSTLKNFLRMKEFAPIVNHFKLGNWIRVEIDNVIYKLRLIEYEIDFEDLNNIRVTFSDVEKLYNGYSDIKSILNSAQSISTSYDSLKRQSTINSNGVNKVNNWIQKGLDMTNLKIISDADMQNISWDEHGFLCRQYNEVLSDYNPTQLKIINNGAYITDDNWKHARTGIGKFIYFDPKDSKYKEGFGVIADTIVSNIILSNEVGIYNTEKSIEMGKNGIIVTTNTAGKNVFTIQKEYTDDDGNVFLERQLYIDDNGNIVLGGGSKISWENVIGGSDYVDNAIGKVKEDIDSFTKEVTEDVASLQSQIDGNITTWFYDYEPTTSNYPASEWTTPELKNQHLGDLFYIVNNSEKNGMCYRYALVDGTYTWIIVEDAELAKALADAARAQDTADKKRRVFVKTPVPPYDIGDLWTQGEDGDLLRCIKAKAKSESFESSDWVLATKYTDDTALNSFINGAFTQKVNYLTQQADKKAETWYQETDPSVDWTDDEKTSHKGDLWYDTQNQKTFIYNGTDWEPTKTTPPDEVFDKIDGKAFIFINQPKPPYHEGDLWFNSISSDIMTCVHSRGIGDFVSSDWEKRNKYTDDSSLTDFINNTYTEKINYLTQQIDGKVETFRSNTDPSINWTEEEKLLHVGDLWYDTNTQVIKVYNGSAWDESSISDVPEEVWNQISGKAQIFTTTPTPPYNIGDLWVQGENGDIMRCKVVKVKGDSYDQSDWVKASKYTDDTTANEALGKVNDLSSDYNTLKEILGYNGTTITSTYLYSPHIVGGDISIGSSSSGVQAQIKSDGKLIATGAEISGAITATSLTLGSGVKIDYSNISNAPTIPDISLCIKKDGTIGIVSEGSTGFKVSSTGKLEASNAIIWGNIYASGGTIGGLNLYSNSISSSNDNFSITSDGKLTAKNASISGDIVANSLTVKQKYKLYYQDANGVPQYSKTIIYGKSWDNNERSLYFGMDVDDNTLSNPYIYMGVDNSGNEFVTLKCDQMNLSSSWVNIGSYGVNNEVSIINGVITAKGLTVNGDTKFNSKIYMANNQAIFAQNSSGTSIIMMNWSSSNNLWIGNGDKSTLPVKILIGAPAMMPYFDNYTSLGGSNNRWTKVYAVTGTIQTSDERDKNIIGSVDQRYRQLYMHLNPIMYRWKDSNIDSKVHIGLGAQSTEKEAMICDIVPEQLGMIQHDFWEEPSIDGRTDRYGMNYQEIAVLTVPIVQEHETIIAKLQSQNQQLQNQLLILQGELTILKQQMEEMKK